MSFEYIVGNEKIKKMLNNSLKSQNILHSYLFSGRDGIGKFLFAKVFAKSILCENMNGCNFCKSCLEFNTQNNPDFTIIEPDGNSIKIGQIRTLQEKIIEKPIISKKKVYIINDADKMTIEAQNCFLKTLEEPQSFVVIIMIAANENKLLTTIKSRCTKIAFEKIDTKQIINFLNEKKLEIFKDKINSVQFDNSMVELSEGSIGKAIKIVEKSEILKQLEFYIDSFATLSELDIFKMEEFFSNNKDDVFILLDYFTMLLYKQLKNNLNEKDAYIDSINIIQKTKNKLVNSNNFEMTIDNMLFKIWEGFSEKYNRY